MTLMEYEITSFDIHIEVFSFHNWKLLVHEAVALHNSEWNFSALIFKVNTNLARLLTIQTFA